MSILNNLKVLVELNFMESTYPKPSWSRHNQVVDVWWSITFLSPFIFWLQFFWVKIHQVDFSIWLQYVGLNYLINSPANPNNFSQEEGLCESSRAYWQVFSYSVVKILVILGLNLTLVWLYETHSQLPFEQMGLNAHITSIFLNKFIFLQEE